MRLLDEICATHGAPCVIRPKIESFIGGLRRTVSARRLTTKTVTFTTGL